jgi:hypothetical protein
MRYYVNRTRFLAVCKIFSIEGTARTRNVSYDGQPFLFCLFYIDGWRVISETTDGETCEVRTVP